MKRGKERKEQERKRERMKKKEREWMRERGMRLLSPSLSLCSSFNIQSSMASLQSGPSLRERERERRRKREKEEEKERET